MDQKQVHQKINIAIMGLQKTNGNSIDKIPNGYFDLKTIMFGVDRPVRRTMLGRLNVTHVNVGEMSGAESRSLLNKIEDQMLLFYHPPLVIDKSSVRATSLLRTFFTRLFN